jgi:hypothetical protein
MEVDSVVKKMRYVRAMVGNDGELNAQTRMRGSMRRIDSGIKSLFGSW